MDPSRYRQIKNHFNVLVDLDPTQWEFQLQEIGLEDEALAAEVRRLLSAHLQVSQFLDAPVVDAIPEVLNQNAVLQLERQWEGRFKIQKTLGQGGMGTVFLAEQIEPAQRLVAIKTIKPGLASRELQARFEAECQALALMNHPNICQLFEAGTLSDGQPYFAMEYVVGWSITDFCRNRNLDLGQRVRLLARVCKAVHHAHQIGIIHRDLKPSNVLIVEGEDGPIPKIIDFGILKAIDVSLKHQDFDSDESRLGTPSYMSPEHLLGKASDLDVRTDVYALGVLFYQLMTGSLPFQSDRSEPLIKCILQGEPRPPSKRPLAAAKGSLPSIGEMDVIALKALAKERSQRFESAAEMAGELERWSRGEAILTGPPSPYYRVLKFMGKHKLAVSFCSAMLGALLFSIVSTAFSLDRAVDTANRARMVQEHAEKQAKTAAAVWSFLQEMLTSADPSEDGREVTVVEVLDRLNNSLAASETQGPGVRAALLNLSGDAYYRLGKPLLAVETLAQVCALEGIGNSELDETAVLLSKLILETKSQSQASEPILWDLQLLLSQARYRQGKQKQALDLAHRVYGDRLRSLGEDHPATEEALAHWRKLKQ